MTKTSKSKSATQPEAAMLLRTRGEDGSIYTFDIATRQWTAERSGKVRRAKDLGRLQDTVKKSEGGGAKGQDELVETSVLGLAGWDNGSLLATPVDIKLQSTPDGPALVRYKNREGQRHWNETGASRLRLVSADAVADEDEAVFLQAARQGLVRERVEACARKVFSWWMARKANQAQVYRIDHTDKLFPVGEEDAKDMSSYARSSLVLGSTQWPFLDSNHIHEIMTEGWQPDEDGCLVRGLARVTMKIGHCAEFGVEVRRGDTWQPVLLNEQGGAGSAYTTEASRALLFATVVNEAIVKGLPVVEQWETPPQGEAMGRMAPKKRATITGIVTKTEYHRSMPMLLCEKGGQLFFTRGSHMDALNQLVPVGPEDGIMEEAIRLREEHDGARLPNVSAALGQRVLVEAWNAHLDGQPEAPGGAAGQAAWDARVRQWKKQAAASDTVVAIDEACHAIEAKLALPPSARRARP